MSDLPEDPTAPLELSRLGPDARALSEEDFASRHGLAFLLHQGSLDPSRKPTRPQATMIMGRVLPPPETQPTRMPRRDAYRGVGLLPVYPVRHTGRSPFPRIVTVGRTKNNDIVLADVGISKFHAFFKEEAGQFFIADGESRNGTFVGGERALPTKQGKPTPLTSGMAVKFGALEFRFVDTHELVILARQFG